MRVDIIGHARIKYVVKYQSCMVQNGRFIPHASCSSLLKSVPRCFVDAPSHPEFRTVARCLMMHRACCVICTYVLLLQATALTKAAAVELEACVGGGISLRLRSNQSSCTVSCFTTSILIVLQAAKQEGGWCTRFTSRRRVLRYPCVYGPFTYNRW